MRGTSPPWRWIRSAQGCQHVACLGVVESNSGNVAFELFLAEREDRGERAGGRKQPPRRLVHADVGRLRRQRSPAIQQLERARAIRVPWSASGFRLRAGDGRFPARSCGFTRRQLRPASLRARVRPRPARRCVSSRACVNGRLCRRKFCRAYTGVHCEPFVARIVKRAGNAARSASAVRSSCAATIVMQSTGHGAMHRSQPVHSSISTVCMRFGAPTIASTGQAWMHLVQPMQTSSSIKASSGAFSMPLAGFNGLTLRSSSAASISGCRPRRPVDTD